jgi:hypothetical protein
MMPRVRPPKRRIAMLRSMDPINDKVDYENGRYDLNHARQALNKMNRAIQVRWRKTANPPLDQVSADAIDR